MRAANNGGGPRGRVANVPDAVEQLTPAGVRAVAGDLETYELFQSAGAWARLPERFRRHAVATRHAAERIADLADVGQRDELAAAALLHDIGQLVLMRLYPATRSSATARRHARAARPRRAPRARHRPHAGRRRARPALGPPGADRQRDRAPSLPTRRASPRRSGSATWSSTTPPATSSPARRCARPPAALEIGDDALSSLLYEFPHAGVRAAPSASPARSRMREVDALRGLAEGKVYKEIAAEMGLSASTVRTHLHNVYRKIGAADRAQAVLVARERGWI